MNNSIHGLLIVEDNDNHFFLVQVAVAKWSRSCPVKRAVNAVEAAQLLQNAVAPQIEGIITDFQMPGGMNGLMFLKWLHTHAEFKSIPVIMFSSAVTPSRAAEARNLGALEVYEKAFDHDTLFQILSTSFPHLRNY